MKLNSTYGLKFQKFAEDSRFQFVQSRGLVVNFRSAIYKCFSLNFSFEYDNEGQGNAMKDRECSDFVLLFVQRRTCSVQEVVRRVRVQTCKRFQINI